MSTETAIPRNIQEQIASAYRRMAVAANYRPQAPSDGLGHITVPVEDLDLDREAARYSAAWWAEEDDLRFVIGCCDYVTRPATIFAVEAARLLCGGFDARRHARLLLSMALADLDAIDKGTP